MGKEHKKKPPTKRNRNIEFDEMEDVKEKGKRMDKASKSPRKMGRKRRKSEDLMSTSPTVARFDEDGNEILVEIGCPGDSEFPSEDECEVEMSQNNNATVTKERRCEKGGSVKKAVKRKLLVDEVYDSSAEEGELSSPRASARRTQRPSNSDAVTMETVTEVPEELCMCNEATSTLQEINKQSDGPVSTEDLINKAVNQTYLKLMQYMKDNGIVLGNPNNKAEQNERNQEPSRRRESRSRGNVEILQLDNSHSATTIYESAIRPLHPEGSPTPLNSSEENQRLSTSSEEHAIDTSDEALDLTEKINEGLNIIAEKSVNINQRGRNQDRFYDEEPIPGTSNHEVVCYSEPRRYGQAQVRRECSPETMAKDRGRTIG